VTNVFVLVCAWVDLLEVDCFAGQREVVGERSVWVVEQVSWRKRQRLLLPLFMASLFKG